MRRFPVLERKSRRDLIGSTCPICGDLIRGRGLTVGQYSYTHKMVDGNRCVAHWGTTYAPRIVHNSEPPAAAAGELRRSRRSKTRRSTPHAGGRPKSFIAALVVAHAAKLFGEHRRWSAVLEQLRSSGNGTYARNTLIRRVAEYSSGQNSAPGAPAGLRRRAPRGASKTGRRMLGARR